MDDIVKISSTMLLLYLWLIWCFKTRHLDLHSTMLLLYRDGVVILILTFFNLHSTMLLLYLNTDLKMILSLLIFTFHYASTLSNNYDLNVFNGFVFTFHYASTLSIFVRSAASLLCHLHSTMLLLYPSPARFPAMLKSIYIPLCFYFIHVPFDIPCLVSPFTFHYASTLSLALPASGQPTHHLHSTMLLLYRARSASVHHDTI